MNQAVKTIQSMLFSLQDPKYRAFQQKLIPNIDPESIIGVRTPALRNLAKDLSGTPEAASFLQCLPHPYFDENNLHAFLIARIKDFDQAVEAVDRFLPYVNNWATCDQLSPKVFSKHPDALLPHIKTWIESSHTYTIRFGVGMLMQHYLDQNFSSSYPDVVASIQSDEYYVNMMIAWYFATALAKQYSAVLPYFQQPHLAPWTHNKAIQKAIESYRITGEQKAYLRTLKIKGAAGRDPAAKQPR